ncbi:hypothetical protein DIURU_004580 [Diutina rugosa]|uniref:BioF2-like acetyltransferase domain-containing protein n=1 Tax=Diutina rugosa TaxID=5481 RepID=A0A642UH15_DIURU|nr:uncharacterized protein DIURU_004580 [Diutina rugosa]KAA8898736.1 hypothetical protein DIURU_004580 [Diutina rugosa]
MRLSRTLHWLRGPWFLWFYSFAFNLADVVMFYVLSSSDHDKYPYPVISLTLNVVVLIMLVYDRLHARFIDAKPGEEPTPRQAKIGKYTKMIRKPYLLFKTIIWLFICAMCISRVILITYRPSTDEFPSRGDQNAFIVVTVFAAICDCGLLTIWWQASIRTTHGLLAFASAIHGLLGVGIVQININLIKNQEHLSRIHNLYVFDGAFILAQAFFGLTVTMVISDKNRLNSVIGKLIFLYDAMLLVVTALTVACLITVFPTLHYHQDMPVSNPILFGISIGVAIVCYVCSRVFRIRFPSTDLEVMEYDLSTLTETQRQGWAKVIDLNHKLNAGVSGDAVISLMNCYCQAELPGMTCKVLRVVKKSSLEREYTPRDLEKANDISKAWDALDHEGLLFQKDGKEDPQSWSDTTTVLEEYKPLSKTKLKRMAKKQKSEQLMESIEELQLKMEKFYNELTNTEALIMITIVEEFDLAERIPAKFGGKWLQRHFGKNSKWPLLVLKFGLLGFHWPFKRSTFYCSSTKKPVARSAAIMHALSEWNEKSGERCTVMVDPTYKHDYAETGIRFSGWYKVGLPSTHIADLRPYKNKTLQQYFKAKKYRVQDKAFNEANGEVIEIKDVTMEQCEEICYLNEMIGDARSDNDQSDTLFHPTPQFVYDQCHIDNSKNYRSLLFLKVNGKYIASCIIYRLGETMTMDINGIDYGADAKQYKAYFVLMQEVIRLALKENISFVDFGPTTENAKVDIGCSVVPLVGSLYTRMKAIGPIVKFAADRVDV